MTAAKQFKGSFTIDVLPPIDLTEYVQSTFRIGASGGNGPVFYDSPAGRVETHVGTSIWRFARVCNPAFGGP